VGISVISKEICKIGKIYMEEIDFFAKSEQSLMHDFGNYHKDLLVSVSLVGCFSILLVLFGIFFYRSYKDYQKYLRNEKGSHRNDEEFLPLNNVSIQSPAPCMVRQVDTNSSEISRHIVQQQGRNSESFYKVQNGDSELVGATTGKKGLCSDIEPRSDTISSANAFKGAQALLKATSNNLHNIFRGLSSMSHSAAEHLNHKKASKELTTSSTITLPSSMLGSPLCTPIRVVDKMGKTDGISNIPTNIAGLEIRFTSPNHPDHSSINDNKSSRTTKYTIKYLSSLGSEEKMNTLINMANEGTTLLSSIMLPNTPLMPNAGRKDIMDDLQDISDEFNRYRDETTPLLIQTVRFLSHSLGMQRYQNPRIFTQNYANVIKQIINQGLVKKVSDVSPILQILLSETIMRYCMASWKFSTAEHKVLDVKLAEWELEPSVPNKLETCKLILKMLESKVLTSSFLDLLDIFSVQKDDEIIAFLESRLKDFKNISLVYEKLSAIIRKKSLKKVTSTLSLAKNKSGHINDSLPGSLYRRQGKQNNV